MSEEESVAQNIPDPLIRLAASLIFDTHVTDGQEPTAESRKRNLEQIQPPAKPVEIDKATLDRRKAALDKEFWDSQA